MELDLVIRNGLIVIPEAGVIKGSLAIQGEKIVGIHESGSGLLAKEIIDARGKYVLPGVVQPHAHLGRLTEMLDWETETGSAAVGGTTTVLDFLRAKGDYRDGFSKDLEFIKRRPYIDFSYHFHVMSDVHLENLTRYVRELGISSFKFNMGYKGEESVQKGIDDLNDGLMLAAFSKLADLKGTMACVHAENSEIITYETARLKRQGRDGVRVWSEARPPASETESIHRTLYLSELTGCPLYIVHLTTGEGLRLVNEHRARGLSKTYVEICPQYLTHHMDDDPRTIGKFTPPLRTRADNEALWQGLIRGEVDTIGIDQITRKPEGEEISIWKRNTLPREAVTTLPLLISEGLYKRGLSIETIAKVTSYNAARIFNLYPKKGTLMVGSDADMVIVDPNLEKKVTREILKSQSDFSIFEGWTLRGWPTLTVCRGKVIMRNGDVVGTPGWGVFLERKP